MMSSDTMLNRRSLFHVTALCILGLSLLFNSATRADSIPAKTVVLTFDDSVKSHATIVAPLLKELGFNATFFITEGFTFKTDKENYMTWAEIKQLHSDGFEIGNHTRDHQGMTKGSLATYKEQIDVINEQCNKHGIPRPVSFAYPGNAFHLDGLPLLKNSGFKFARRGGSPEYTYEEGGGVGYEPGKDHALLIPSVGDARPNWTLEDFKTALHRAQPGSIAVLQFHGVPDKEHPWVHTPPERFREYMMYLKENGYTVLALRDLEKFVDLSIVPADPMTVIKERQKAIASKKAKH
jgi:peptidoglycan/xylan/chitin deacetylase (PgdA/CDA1 family)